MIYTYKGESKLYKNMTISDQEISVTLNPGDLLDIYKDRVVNITANSGICYLDEEEMEEVKNNSILIIEDIEIDDGFEDEVNHPSHYCTGDIECIDAMISTYGKEAVCNFCICNAFKYLWRFNHKNGNEDINKMMWYINKFKELSNS